jgi:ATP adenylyltransferase
MAGRLAPGNLRVAIRQRIERALRSGALEPVRADVTPVEDGGVTFAVRVRRGLSRKRTAARTAKPPNPFLPYEEALFVADLSDTHLCLLNKYPVMPGHVLIVTREFEPQQAPLSLPDFEALWTCLGEVDGLGFYNSAPLAGASQGHRHLQLVAGPLGARGEPVPVDRIIEQARFDDAVGVAPGFPFLHAVARLRACARLAPPDATRVLLALYEQMLRAFGCDDPTRPYNLLLTRDWMLFVPRLRERWGSISVNALGFAGSFFVETPDELERLRRAGPMQALRHVGVARVGAR